MKHLLNYKYEIFPTKPQREQLNRTFRQTKIQWNKAVTIRKKLKSALMSGQFEHVIKTYLSAAADKSNTSSNRKKAILKVQQSLPQIDFETAAKLYDIKNLVGKVLGELTPRHADIAFLVNELKTSHSKELAERKAAIANGATGKSLPKLKTYWQMITAIGQLAGFKAKTFMDDSFESPSGMALSAIRFNVSGTKNAVRWNQAVQPKPGQRTYGATGEPRYKRRSDGFAYQIHDAAPADLIRSKKKNGHQIHLKALHKGNAWVDFAYHRPVPVDGKIKQFTVMTKAGRYFIALSTEVPTSAWAIAPMEAGWHAGIDPGAQTALTVGLVNSTSGEIKHLAIHYEFLEKSLTKLETLQQALSLKQGPRRKRTEVEIQEALTQYSKKRAVQKLTNAEKEKTLAKERERLERRMVFQGASRKWRQGAKSVSSLMLKIANQRQDVLHKISRALAEGCDVVGIGHWEPEREVSFRKKLRLLKKQVKAGVAGATATLKEHIEEKSKEGPKGIKKRRRGGRDRSIATLRMLINEKAVRSGVKAFTDINESYSTMTCSSCGEATGPTGIVNLGIREWQCGNCNVSHHRDLNSAFNILKKTELELAAAQAAAPATGSTATRTDAQGAQSTPGSDSGSGYLATGHHGRGGSFFYEHAEVSLPDLWKEEVPRALKSLIQMGVVRALTLQRADEKSSKSPPAQT